MSDLLLKGFVVKSIEYANNIVGTETMEISSMANTNVHYDDAKSECNCSFDLAIKNIGEKDLLHASIKAEGLFGFDTDMEKREIHVKASKIMFYQTRTLLASVCGVAGIPPFVVPDINFDDYKIIETKA